mmetsp:Transcript_11392/g.27822  ORF Transcript_11392/g.27822 Transcript_11392/m.27822 type:complete len:175 (-) Transcript_11392:184-708(-)|eukprot:CAMPEP_0178990978 /NCGR_PEP_ID=MMETSP0795-20121207/5265_1 /TAXON_ID=88552 /ORGANISM="Amoebophrya sp., Strain Ameob2" /LENGTH=174 /DNA_ID=CAMNT_0020682621 /DNA_START=313 /DNA_END=840 /DNA_ORIENTATION=+
MEGDHDLRVAVRLMRQESRRLDAAIAAEQWQIDTELQNTVAGMNLNQQRKRNANSQQDESARSAITMRRAVLAALQPGGTDRAGLLRKLRRCAIKAIQHHHGGARAPPHPFLSLPSSTSADGGGGWKTKRRGHYQDKHGDGARAGERDGEVEPSPSSEADSRVVHEFLAQFERS